MISAFVISLVDIFGRVFFFTHSLRSFLHTHKRSYLISSHVSIQYLYVALIWNFSYYIAICQCRVDIIIDIKRISLTKNLIRINLIANRAITNFKLKSNSQMWIKQFYFFVTHKMMFTFAFAFALQQSQRVGARDRKWKEKKSHPPSV